MSLYLLEGFDYDNSTGLSKVWLISNTARVSLDNQGYKFGRSIRFNTTTVSSNTQLSLRETGTLPLSGVVGFWYKTNWDTYHDNVPSLFGFFPDTSTTAGTFNIQVIGSCREPISLVWKDFTTDRSIRTRRTLSPNVWYHFELQYQIKNGTNIPLILRVNGKEVARASESYRTTYHASNYLVLGRYLTTDLTAFAYYDHLYLYDFNGTETGFRGPCLVSGAYPVSNGDINSWNKVPSTGNAWDVVDDFYEQSNYVAASTSGAQQLYNLKDMTDNSVSIQGIQHHILANRQGPSNVKLKTLYRYDSNNYVTNTGNLLYSHGEFYTTNLSVEKNPIGNTPWTTGDLGNGQFGFEIWNTGV